ncbi:cytochrome P450 [Cristinia sonorae]|uniref:Cytochrome P450 n=1 Tax=Cristinia sonorae TaxID=1940300 RepID=A0A8K0UJ20_9AGAR|nr:cytochrome P450 [Cristinia sonorae]
MVLGLAVLDIVLPLLVLGWLVVRVLRIGSRSACLPPGPPTVPVLGNAHMFPQELPHLKLTEWAHEYGDIYSLKLGPSTMVVVSNPRITNDLMIQRSATTSGRQSMQLVNDITGGLTLPVMPYGRLFRDFRRAMRDMLSREACVQHLPIQIAESKQLMYDLMKAPHHIRHHAQRYSASVVLAVAFGLRAPRYSNSLVSEFFETYRAFENILVPGSAPPIDHFPILNHIPERFAVWKRRSREIREGQRRLWFKLADICQQRLDEHRPSGCFLESVLKKKDRYELDHEQIAYLGGNLMEGGSDTTSVFMETFISLMVQYPEVQKRAQEEIDAVVGNSRSPIYADFESLPYLQAVIKEVHRFHPTAPVTIPHVATADERVGDYTIPKDSLILVNMWAIYRDEESFDHPETFDPDRFLKSEFGTKEGADDTGRRHDIVFGCGRRICPGMELALNSLKINTMNLLWAFDMHPPIDPNTGERAPFRPTDVTHGLLLTQEIYQCDIQPRSRAHADIIKADYAAARDVFVSFEKELSEDERRFVAEW